MQLGVRQRVSMSKFEMVKVSVTVVLLSVCVVASLHAEDWPQWRGADRLAIWTEDGIIDRFPEGGLNVTWRVPVKAGFSGPVVADGRVFVTDFEFLPDTRVADGTERILALDEQTGDVLWTTGGRPPTGTSWARTRQALGRHPALMVIGSTSLGRAA